MLLFYQPQIPSGVYYLTPEESKHCSRVLRKKPGDIITVTDGQHTFHEVKLTQTAPEQCSFTILKTWKAAPRPFHIHIAIAPTKHTDRIEWFVEKAVEIGIDEISFIYCQHSERHHFKTDRVTRVAISAMKQSLKASLPQINAPIPFRKFITTPRSSTNFIAYTPTETTAHLLHLASPTRSYCSLIGPEGDFSEEELDLASQADYVPVSLGPSRLRTETAGLVACQILNLLNV